VPESIDPHEIFVVVDPYQVQEDRDRTNNSASVVVLAADLTITEIAVQAAGPHRIITIRVENVGSLEVPAVDTVLRRDAVDGEVLTTVSITDPIIAGAYRDVSWTWEDAAPFVGGAVRLYAIVDEDDLIGEFDESNNVRVAVLGNAPPEYPGDWDQDGSVDLDDWMAFPDCMSGPWDVADWTMPSAETRRAGEPAGFFGDGDLRTR